MAPGERSRGPKNSAGSSVSGSRAMDSCFVGDLSRAYSGRRCSGAVTRADHRTQAVVFSCCAPASCCARTSAVAGGSQQHLGGGLQPFDPTERFVLVLDVHGHIRIDAGQGGDEPVPEVLIVALAESDEVPG